MRYSLVFALFGLLAINAVWAQSESVDQQSVGSQQADEKVARSERREESVVQSDAVQSSAASENQADQLAGLNLPSLDVGASDLTIDPNLLRLYELIQGQGDGFRGRRQTGGRRRWGNYYNRYNGWRGKRSVQGGGSQSSLQGGRLSGLQSGLQGGRQGGLQGGRLGGLQGGRWGGRQGGLQGGRVGGLQSGLGQVGGSRRNKRQVAAQPVAGGTAGRAAVGAAAGVPAINGGAISSYYRPGFSTPGGLMSGPSSQLGYGYGYRPYRYIQRY